MKKSHFHLVLQGAFTLLMAAAVQAQGLRTPQGLGAGGLRAAPPAPVARTVSGTSDFIVAIVDSEPVTNQEIVAQASRVRAQAAQQGVALPARQQLLGEALEQLIYERTQLQWAQQTGLKVTDEEVDQLERSVAERNQLTLSEFRSQLEREGFSLTQYRQSLRNQQILQRLREREVPSRIKVSDQEIDQFLTQQKSQMQTQQLHLAQLLVAVPDDASAAEVQQLQDKAHALLKQAREGADFFRLARDNSQAQDRANGGQMGLRTVDRYPSLFVEATQKAAVGDVVGPVRSGAGFHLLKVIEKPKAESALTIAQTHARHILLRPGGQLSQTAARAQLTQMKRRVEQGQANFADLAKEFSQDASASQGGELGWASAGMFVPEFEEVMNRLGIDEISEPLISRFGVHLIQVLARRNNPLTVREEREYARNALKERKYNETYETWAQEIRGRAYIEYREPPQ
ncbi:MAG: molecular chaperone SurA [Limnohabitans sp.]|nr:molecular chaperone SurA [Limnohabitans sp.]